MSLNLLLQNLILSLRLRRVSNIYGADVDDRSLPHVQQCLCRLVQSHPTQRNLLIHVKFATILTKLEQKYHIIPILGHVKKPKPISRQSPHDRGGTRQVHIRQLGQSNAMEMIDWASLTIGSVVWKGCSTNMYDAEAKKPCVEVRLNIWKTRAGLVAEVTNLGQCHLSKHHQYIDCAKAYVDATCFTANVS